MNQEQLYELRQLERNSELRSKALMHNIRIIMEEKKDKRNGLFKRKIHVEPKAW